MIPLSDLFAYCRKMIEENWGYIYGTAGEKWTASKQNKLESEHSEDDSNWGASVRYGKKWIDHTVTDCSGVMVYIWKQYGLKIPHGSSSMVRQGYIVDCSSIPKPGYAALVDPTPETDDNKHIGIVMEDGQTVFEAKGANAGCVYSKITDSKWTKFGRFKDVDYSGGVTPLIPPYYAIVATNSGSLNVRAGNGTEYPKIGKVEKGQTVIVKSHGAEWDFIDADGLQGYCATQYLRPEKEVPVDPEPEPQPETEYVIIQMPLQTAERWKKDMEEMLEMLKAGGV